MNRHYDQLDSLRGIAASLVFLSHISLVTTVPILLLTFSFYSPINMLFQGNSTVICFFILSGFVLYLPYVYGNESRYGVFIVKRFFRVYIPYLIAIILSIVACYLFSKGGIKELSDWFNYTWTQSITIKNIVQHIFLLENFNTNTFNNPIWYVVQELRISLIFPFIAIMIRRFNWKISLLIGVALSLVSGLNNLFHWQRSAGYQTTYFHTLEFINMYIIGAILAKHINVICLFYEKLSNVKKIILLLFAIFSISYNMGVAILANYARIWFYGDIASNYCVAAGCIIGLMFALFSKTIRKILLIKPLTLLGKISYSLYLYHLPILFSFIYLFYHKLSFTFIIVISVPVTIVVAYIAFRYIEKPSIKIGKYFIKRSLSKNQNRTIVNVDTKIDKII